MFSQWHNRLAVLAHLLSWTSLVAVVALGTSGCGAIATGHNARGVREYLAGNYYGAMEQFQKAMSAKPDDADAYYNLAATMHKLGIASKNENMLQQAEMMYNQCLDRDPNHVDCYRGLAVLLAQTQRIDRAEKLLKNWAMRSPQNADARIELARLFDELGDKKTAQLQLQQAIQLDQTNRRAWTALAALRESQGDYKQALADYQRAYSLNPQDKVIAARIAALNQAVGTPAQSLQAGGTRTVQAPTATARY